LPRLGFDAVRALRNSTGLGNYGRRVLRGVLAADSGVRGVLYSPAPPRPAYAGLPAELGAPLVLPSPLWRTAGARSWWRSGRLGRRAAADGVELFHGLSHEIPRDLPQRGIPSVVSFLDLLWVRYPGLYPRVDRLSYEWRYRWSAERATAIVAASRQTAADLRDLYGIAPDRIAVVPPPADSRFARPVPEAERREALARHALPRSFLLSVGTLEARKNQRSAIAALAQLDPSRTPPLVLVGRDGGSRAELLRLATRLGVADRLLIRDAVRDADLPAVMQSAAVFLYPSLFEGFGLPIIEALAAGVPVITTAGGCFEEAGGPGTLYAPATDASALAAQLRRVLDDAALAERMRRAGRRHARRFAAARLAARLLGVYQSVLRGERLPADADTATEEEQDRCAG